MDRVRSRDQETSNPKDSWKEGTGAGRSAERDMRPCAQRKVEEERKGGWREEAQANKQ